MFGDKYTSSPTHIHGLHDFIDILICQRGVDWQTDVMFVPISLNWQVLLLSEDGVSVYAAVNYGHRNIAFFHCVNKIFPFINQDCIKPICATWIAKRAYVRKFVLVNIRN